MSSLFSSFLDGAGFVRALSAWLREKGGNLSSLCSGSCAVSWDPIKPCCKMLGTGSWACALYPLRHTNLSQMFKISELWVSLLQAFSGSMPGDTRVFPHCMVVGITCLPHAGREDQAHYQSNFDPSPSLMNDGLAFLCCMTIALG